MVLARVIVLAVVMVLACIMVLLHVMLLIVLWCYHVVSPCYGVTLFFGVIPHKDVIC